MTNTKTNKRQNQHCRPARRLLNSFLRRLSILTVLLCAASLSLPHCKNDNKSSSSPAPAPCPTEASGFNKGDGRADCPFLISSRSQLEKISMGLDKHYELSQNIDLQDNPFDPILGSFTGSLDGKGYEIQNLTIAVSTKQAGLFAELGAAGSIQNLGIVGLNVTSTNASGSVSNPVQIGALVAEMNGGEIKNCYALDSDGDTDVYGDSGEYDSAGGLVGRQDAGSIIGSYANGDADGGEGDRGYAGGLVGRQGGGRIIGSYATGDAVGGDGGNNSIGGLVGRQFGGSIIGSYATGNADDGADNAAIGGLVGWQAGGSVIGSYATGAADGGVGSNDRVGGLIGYRLGGGSATESYGFGTPTGGAVSTIGDPPDSLTSATGLTAANAGTRWAGAWDFGTISQIPALKYITGATLSGTIVTYDCEPSELPSGLSCGDLLAGQGR